MKINDTVENFEINLTNKVSFDLFQTLKNGPVVINFIKGTWCPMCDSHLKKIREWQSKLPQKITMLIISSEGRESLRKWQDENDMTYLFATDEDLKIINQFKVKRMLRSMASPATFLIDTDKKIKLAFKGMRTKKNNEIVFKNICENGVCDFAA